MDSIADARGFAVCYPQGLLDTAGKTHWNAELRISKVDDIGFLTRLAGALQAEYGFNPAHTFATGFSNGGFMSYTLASKAPEVFRAAAPVAGLMSADTWKGFASTMPVPICHIHGLADPVVPVDGSMTTRGGWGGGPTVDSLEAFWARFNRCTTLDTAFLGPRAHARYHRKGIGGNEVWFIRIDGLAHSWPGSATGINASAVTWEFFARRIAAATGTEKRLAPASIRSGTPPFGPMELFRVNGTRARTPILTASEKRGYRHYADFRACVQWAGSFLCR
jgi:polyhydroxybutyrate depolymerase